MSSRLMLAALVVDQQFQLCRSYLNGPRSLLPWVHFKPRLERVVASFIDLAAGKVSVRSVVLVLRRRVDDAYRRALDAGASSESAPADMPWGERVARVRDPDGFLLNLGSESTR
ncbi:VOC family protein [Paeniglutamicibacter sulfureus]|uniref:Glyoxalase/fosfomycin resistance/dioxygenase domain-containing protein n=2 Tax=Paeniglutamicibacter sulfureus TaxID=43666 RepID=A0ABU2BFB3_9MICC|nr:VOC family protein [Paeniglutamicibacter sulfureus]MDR7357295.1 hypothetical protein [Paeniglutamicibacter sulfureus]